MTDKTAGEAFEVCPFCGKAATLRISTASERWEEQEQDGSYPHSESWQVVCDAASFGPGGCGGSGGYKPTGAEAIAAWNRRASAVAPALQQAAQQALEALCTTHNNQVDGYYFNRARNLAAIAALRAAMALDAGAAPTTGELE